MENEKPKGKVLNKIHLQIIAILAMTVDHVTWVLYPNYEKDFWILALHVIGRLAFPIMAYFIAEGYYYTHDLKKYMKRILLFSLISHVPYMFASIQFAKYGALCFIPFATGRGILRFLNQASVLWSYLIGLVMLWVNDSPKLKEWQKALAIIGLCVLSFPCDWSCIGSLVVLAIGSNRNKPIKQIFFSILFVSMYAIVYFFTMDKVYGLLQLGVVVAIPALSLYNGKKSNHPAVNKFMRYAFYLYYPLHFLLVGLLGLLIR